MRVVPAKQSLHAYNFAAHQIKHWLIVQKQFGIGSRSSEFRIHEQSGLDFGFHGFLETAEIVPSPGFGFVHCCIGILDELMYVVPITRKKT